MSERHVALLRGVNVGGANRLPMARLREVAQELGWQDVMTYIQSGNLVFSATGDPSGLAAVLHEGLASGTGLDVDVLVLTAAEVVALEEDCPWPDVEDARHVHAVLHPQVLGQRAREAVAEAVATSRGRGSRDEAVPVGRVLWLHTPDGAGRSVLMGLLDRAPVRSSSGWATARNLATVRRLRAMVEA
ncbi:DUF1697 domain-containing protein [Ornithinimicrobium pekingense]|uniref:DUF1697 domain-containing protein n=1 Tax=Ornithinimicrobium pekingense TaxID=384677 RepID=A0ABQ2FAG2_9MICO|nr:DUF1697 domain-containing protein [Ornithinimicrobium pekingense]GGK66651.1 hypothetical protein GCM10011509_13780 [Ornithinimicrobium pekingense]